MRNVDSETLFKQARLEMKAAAAYFEAAKSAQRYVDDLRIEREQVYNRTYRETVSLGVPEHIAFHVAQEAAARISKHASEAIEEGLYATEMTNYHRSCGEALLKQCEKARIKEYRRVAKGK